MQPILLLFLILVGVNPSSLPRLDSVTTFYNGGSIGFVIVDGDQRIAVFTKPLALKDPKQPHDYFSKVFARTENLDWNWPKQEPLVRDSKPYHHILSLLGTIQEKARSKTEQKNAEALIMMMENIDDFDPSRLEYTP